MNSGIGANLPDTAALTKKKEQWCMTCFDRTWLQYGKYQFPLMSLSSHKDMPEHTHTHTHTHTQYEDEHSTPRRKLARTVFTLALAT